MQDDLVSGMADEEAVSLDPSSRSSGPSRRAEDSDGMAILAAEVAVIFLFKVSHDFQFIYTLHFIYSQISLCIRTLLCTACPVSV